jgi:NADPH2:quinone reductase
MQAWICDNPVGVEALKWQDVPTPEPGPGEVRVAVRAASLNFPDLLIVQNKYQHKPPLPFVPGAEYAGVVDAVGEGVAGYRRGDHVAVLAGIGGFATHAVARADKLLALPDAFPFEHAAAFAMTYGTSYHALIDRAELKAGETVLVLGAAGGVGTAAIQIAKAAGAHVVAAASSPEKCSQCLSLGADSAIDYTKGNFRESIKERMQGRGPDVVYDPVGGDYTEPAFRSLAWRGRYLVIGFAAGNVPALPLNLPLLKGNSIVGVFWGEFVRREPKAAAAQMAELAAWYAKGVIRPVVDVQLPMQRLPEGYARMAERKVLGKVVLTNA